MQEVRIRIRSFDEVKDFIRISTSQPFPVYIGNDRQMVNSTSYMGLMSLDHTGDLLVQTDCSDSEFLDFRNQAARFLAE